MNANEMRVFLRKDGGMRDDPGPPLNKPYETITVKTSSADFVFQGKGDTARRVLDFIRLGYSTPKLKACHAAIKADGGTTAHIVFKDS